jgi:hypothetical protein
MVLLPTGSASNEKKEESSIYPLYAGQLLLEKATHWQDLRFKPGDQNLRGGTTRIAA